MAVCPRAEIWNQGIDTYQTVRLMINFRAGNVDKRKHLSNFPRKTVGTLLVLYWQTNEDENGEKGEDV
jgi:hypothetical protein